MNENRARETARAIIKEVEQTIRDFDIVGKVAVPDLDRLTKAIQTYVAARYATNPEISWKDGIRDYTEVEVEWQDEEWQVRLYRTHTRVDLPLVQKVLALPGDKYLLRRDGDLELIGGTRLRRDPASGVYLPGDYRPSEEILRAAAAGPFWVYLDRTAISLYPSTIPAVLNFTNPGERVELCYKQHEVQITLGTGELLSHLTMWQLTE